MHGVVWKVASRLNAALVQALETFGTDFSLIAEMFPTRPRRAIKSKYLRESKTNLVGSCSLRAASRHHCTHRPWAS